MALLSPAPRGVSMGETGRPIMRARDMRHARARPCQTPSMTTVSQPRSHPSTPAGIAAVAGIVWLLLDLLRAWTPGLITIFGRAAETPAELIGAFALAVLSAPLLILVVAGRVLVGPVAPLIATAVLALLARLVVPLLPGGPVLLWTASAGVALAVLALALAAGRLGTCLVPGLFCGVAASATTHAGLGTWGAVWRTDLAGWTVTAGLVATLLWGLQRTRAHPRDVDGRSAVSRWVGWSVFPLLLLAGISVANPARAAVVDPAWGDVLLVAAAALGAALATLARPGAGLRVAAVVGLLASAALTMLPSVAVGGIEGRLPAWSLVGVAIGLPSAALALGGLPVSRTSVGARRGARSVAGGAVLFTVLLFAFYAGYDLGYRADVVVVAVAGLLGLVALAAARHLRGDTEAPRPRPARRQLAVSGATVLAAALVAGFGPDLTVRPLTPAAPAAATDSVTVAAWNLRMGYGIDGTFRPDDVADLLREEGVDVLLLSEIDRGWLLNGGQDQLSVLARLLDMEAVFSPAGDQVWGDAILAGSPLSDPRGESLPAYDSLTGASVLAATVALPSGPVRFLSTHLQPDAEGPDSTLRQSRDLAAIMEREAARGGPVVMGGDLNTRPDEAAWEELIGTGYVDALAPARPLLTSSSDDLRSEIDHILTTPGMSTAEPRTVGSLLSDHLPVLVDLEP